MSNWIATHYHWWVSLFLVAGPVDKSDLQHAADTAGYWAQAIGSVAAVFAAIGLSLFQYLQKRCDDRREVKRLRDAVSLIVAGLDEVLASLCDGGLKNAVANGDENFVAQAKRIAGEFHASLAAVSIAELAKANVVVPVFRLRKSSEDIVQILSFVKVNSGQSPDKSVSQLLQVQEHIADARTLLRG